MSPTSRCCFVVTLTVVVCGGATLWAAGAGGTWPEDQELQAAEIGDTDYFGRSIAANGSTALVGAVYDDEGAFGNAGSVCVFELIGGSWIQVDRLLASDYINSGFFGGSVAMSGDSAIIGSHGFNVKRGAAYVFVRGPSEWTEEQKLTAPDAAALDEFGYAVAIDGDTAVIGSFRSDHSLLTDPGSAYVFTRSGSVWSFEQKLVAGEPAHDDWLGYKVAISGDTVAVAALQHNTTGAVYVFTRSGTVWSQEQKLTGSGGADDGNFGRWLALSGETLVVGSSTTDHSSLVNAGAVYVFERTGGTWSEVQRLIPSDAQEYAAFGTSVAMLDDTLLIGATDDVYGVEDAGSAYIFTRSDGVWTEQQELIASNRQEGARLGFAVALTAELALVTAPWFDIDLVSDAGAACSYRHAAQIFADSFESGDPSEWSSAAGTTP